MRSGGIAFRKDGMQSIHRLKGLGRQALGLWFEAPPKKHASVKTIPSFEVASNTDPIAGQSHHTAICICTLPFSSQSNFLTSQAIHVLHL